MGLQTQSNWSIELATSSLWKRAQRTPSLKTQIKKIETTRQRSFRLEPGCNKFELIMLSALLGLHQTAFCWTSLHKTIVSLSYNLFVCHGNAPRSHVYRSSSEQPSMYCYRQFLLTVLDIRLYLCLLQHLDCY